MAPTRAQRDFPGHGIAETLRVARGRDGRRIETTEQRIDRTEQRIRNLISGRTAGEDPDAEPSDAFLVATETGTQWHVEWTFAMQGDQLVVRSVTLEPLTPTTPPGGVTSALLRELSPAAAVARAVEGMPALSEPVMDVPPGRESFGAMLLRWRRQEVEIYERPDAPRPGRPRLSDEHLREVARGYLAEQSRGPGVLRRLAEQFGVQPQTMRDWVHAARERQFLTGGQRGRAGASAGPRLAEPQTSPIKSKKGTERK